MTVPKGWLFIGPYMVPAPTRWRIADIQARVCAFYHVPLIEMVSARRSREIARPRQVAMYLSRRHTVRSLPEIGRQFGKRDHTTVIHACRAIETLRRVDPQFDRGVAALERGLR